MTGITAQSKLGRFVRSLATMLGTRWDAAGDLGTDIAAILAAIGGSTGQGVLQVRNTTIDLNQAAATYTLFTVNAQDVVVEALVFRCPAAAAGGALTSISIQTDDATPQIFITAAQGAVANLTSEAQLAWTGAIMLDLGSAARIQLTIAGGATGVAYVCDVIALYRAIVAGGNLT